MPYNPALDGLRALSILAVVCFHCETPWGRGGLIGVDVFFVLSGYLITSLLLAEHGSGGIQVIRFYARRALRLYPTLLLLIAAYVVLAPSLWPTENRWLFAALGAFYVIDYTLAYSHVTTAIGHTWSLGVEEKFYLLWPLLLPFLLRARRPIAWLVMAFILITVWRNFVALQWGWRPAYYAFDTRMSGMVLGALIALAPRKVSRPAAMIAGATLTTCFAVPVIAFLPSYLSTTVVMLETTLAEISAFVLISYLAERGNNRFLASRPLVYIGRLSYGIYIWHYPAALLFQDAQPWWITLSVVLPFSCAMAMLSLHLVDMPIKRWRKRVLPQRRQMVAT